MRNRFLAKDIDDIHGIAEDISKKLLENSEDSNIILFYGEMGAGKTTLIRHICEAMGVKDVVTSPTFAIINEYLTSNSSTIYHFDFYRIESLREVYDLGYEEYFFSGELCFIEWPSKIEDILEEIKDSTNIATITINVNEKGHREIVYSNLK